MAEFHWDIRVADPSPTSRFAAEEFARLIMLMDDGADAEISSGRYAPGAKALWIGLDAALPAPPQPISIEETNATTSNILHTFFITTPPFIACICFRDPNDPERC